MGAVEVLQDLLTQRNSNRWPLTMEDYLVHKEEVLPVRVEVSGPGKHVGVKSVEHIFSSN